MTLDRDLRFTPLQVTTAQKAIQRRTRELRRKLDRADALRAMGEKIQEGTYGHHVDELTVLENVNTKLEEARKGLI